MFSPTAEAGLKSESGSVLPKNIARQKAEIASKLHEKINHQNGDYRVLLAYCGDRGYVRDLRIAPAAERLHLAATHSVAREDRTAHGFRPVTARFGYSMIEIVHERMAEGQIGGNQEAAFQPLIHRSDCPSVAIRIGVVYPMKTGATQQTESGSWH